MPTDKSGKFHMNTQRAMAADKAPSKHRPVGAEGDLGMGPPSDKSRSDSPSPVHEHLSAMHQAMGGKHMHVHSDGSGMHTTHHVGEDGQVQGPHEHPDMEAVKAHMEQVMGDNDEDEYSGGGHMPMPMQHHGGY